MMSEKAMKSWPILAVAALAAVCGCGDKNDQSPLAAAPAGNPGAAAAVATELEPTGTALAGVPVTEDPLAPTPDLVTVASGYDYTVAMNPWGLRGSETFFHREQLVYRLFDESGGWSNYYEPPELPPITSDVVVRPTPLWRLSGIIIGDAVLALLDMGGGTVIEIRPGSRIPNTDWWVVAIDEDSATLRRPGNIQPNEVVVYLESRIPTLGGGGTGGGGAPAGGGGAPLGGPAAPDGGPAGMPGAPDGIDN